MKKNLIIYSSTFLSFVVISFFWNSINMPTFNKNNVVGYLPLNNINPLNDTLKYLIIILIPLLIYFILSFFFKRKKLINVKELIFEKNLTKENIKIVDIKYLIILILVYLIFEFLINVDFNDFNFDTFHEGDFLSPAQNYLFQNKIWSSALTVHGGSNIIYPLLAWKLFGYNTIGSFKIFITSLIFLLKIASIFLAFQITKISNLNHNYKKIFFVCISILLLSLSSYISHLNYSAFSYRDLYIIIFFIFLIESIIGRSNVIVLVILSIIPFITITLHTDTGVYSYFMYITYLFYLLTQSKFREIVISLFSNFFIILLFYIFFGEQEILNLFLNLFIIASNIDLLFGLEFPAPIFEMGETSQSTRGTKALFSQLIAGVLIVNSVFFKKEFYKNKKIVLIFLFILSFIMFKNALGRSDEYHIRMSSEWPTIIIFFFIIEYILKKIQKRITLDEIKFKLFIFSFIILIFFINVPNYNLTNLKNFKKNLVDYTMSKDGKFIKEERENKINLMNTLFNNEKCLLNFTEDLSLLYFLKKPSCSKYLIPHLASGRILEDKFLNDIMELKPKFIIYESPMHRIDMISMRKRLPEINNYIIKNYKEIYNNDGYIIKKIIN